RCAKTSIESDKVYLLTNGQETVMWVGNALPMMLSAEIFGVTSVNQIDPTTTTIPYLDNDTNRYVHTTLNSLYSYSGSTIPLIIDKEGNQLSIFRTQLKEDCIPSRADYVDYTCFIHREIRKLLS
uniref:hypothetical protein n=1 Tax=Salmonella sp. s54836 TaxID=3159673 RepID=UPI003980F61D